MKVNIVAWKYQGKGIDFGRVLYSRSRKWWGRIGPYIISIECFSKDSDAYSDDEQKMERENMRAMLEAAHLTNGPGAYCRACQGVGMSNCQHFDECSGATCITCHRPFNASPPATVDVGAGKEALAIIDKWMESYDHMGTGTSAVARMSEREWEEDRAKLAALIGEKV